ncbi:unnamed protein product [Adineta steineri]|uniref:Uncharacterized protein n=1 Tax=Adineta steineri TaxID=433720 RepID=A0A813UGA6_9BILA|nr:unnamed protein product [Adineta steineri]CAF0838754.1 unnamed protein product [Adineta steineri]CAF1460784.1 unnamed protein product [Adineta steineri]CAF3797775.1 unnamed protein product [Adineta steineri]CAF4084425.1 unnamed protein product [Adineta steineri]
MNTVASTKTTTTTTTTTAVPTCSPSVCCTANCGSCVFAGTTYYCTRYGGPDGYNFYTSLSSCVASGSSSYFCTYSTTCGVGSATPGVGSGSGC